MFHTKTYPFIKHTFTHVTRKQMFFFGERTKKYSVRTTGFRKVVDSGKGG